LETLNLIIKHGDEENLNKMSTFTIPPPAPVALNDGSSVSENW